MYVPPVTRATLKQRAAAAANRLKLLKAVLGNIQYRARAEKTLRGASRIHVIAYYVCGDRTIEITGDWIEVDSQDAITKSASVEQKVVTFLQHLEARAIQAMKLGREDGKSICPAAFTYSYYGFDKN